MLLVVNVHPDRAADLRTPGEITYRPLFRRMTYHGRVRQYLHPHRRARRAA